MKPLLILDNHFRKREELFRDEAFDAMCDLCDVRGGRNAPMDRAEILACLPDASFYIASRPELTARNVAAAKSLKAVIEVAGAFRDGLDYDACFRQGVEVLSCSPGFRNSVAEMTLAMILAGGRGLVDEHEAFRNGTERWLDDRDESDFSVYHQHIGFIGYGQISKETHRLLKPFSPRVMAYDPFITDPSPNVEFADLETVVSNCRVIVMAAVPSEDTRGLLNADLIRMLRPGALVVVISRAWSVDFTALMAAAASGRIKVATDVFPDEPLARDDPLRQGSNVILSPHRAAAVPGGRHLIGDMILDDIQAILSQKPTRNLKRADPASVAGLLSAQRALKPIPNT